MTSKRFQARDRSVGFPGYMTEGEEILVRWNGRHEAGAAVELMAWTPRHNGPYVTQTYRISLGDLLRGLGVTAADCRAALAAVTDEPPRCARTGCPHPARWLVQARDITERVCGTHRRMWDRSVCTPIRAGKDVSHE